MKFCLQKVYSLIGETETIESSNRQKRIKHGDTLQGDTLYLGGIVNLAWEVFEDNNHKLKE